jgi:hypothetical protein
MQDTLFVSLQPTFEHISSSKQYKNKKERTNTKMVGDFKHIAMTLKSSKRDK